MRVVLDTNVVVSGVFFGGVPGKELATWSEGVFVLALSPAILEEYRRVGHEIALRYPAASAAFAPVLTLLAMNAVIVDAPELAAPVSADSDDDKFLAVAVAAKAAVIVSGDQDLLQVSGWRGIDVLTPRQFLEHHVSP